MMCCRRVSVLDTNRARSGRPACPAPLRTHRSPATVALPFVLMCAIVGTGSTCRSLLCDAQPSQSVAANLGIGDTSRRRLLSLCSNLRQVGILKHLRCEDGNLHRHRPVICRASMEANFRWTTTSGLVFWRLFKQCRFGHVKPHDRAAAVWPSHARWCDLRRQP